MNKLLSILVVAGFIFAIVTASALAQTSSPVVGTKSDSRIQVQVTSYQTAPSIQYTPSTPSTPNYIWAWVNVIVTNEMSTGTITVDPLFASIQDSQGYSYTTDFVSDPQSMQTETVGPGQMVRGNIYFEIPAGASIVSFTWNDYTSNIQIGAGPASASTSPSTSGVSPSPSPASSPTIPEISLFGVITTLIVATLLLALKGRIRSR